MRVLLALLLWLPGMALAGGGANQMELASDPVFSADVLHAGLVVARSVANGPTGPSAEAAKRYLNDPQCYRDSLILLIVAGPKVAASPRLTSSGTGYVAVATPTTPGTDLSTLPPLTFDQLLDAVIEAWDDLALITCERSL